MSGFSEFLFLTLLFFMVSHCEDSIDPISTVQILEKLITYVYRRVQIDDKTQISDY